MIFVFVDFVAGQVVVVLVVVSVGKAVGVVG